MSSLRNIFILNYKQPLAFVDFVKADDAYISIQIIYKKFKWCKNIAVTSVAVNPKLSITYLIVCLVLGWFVSEEYLFIASSYGYRQSKRNINYYR